MHGVHVRGADRVEDVGRDARHHRNDEVRVPHVALELLGERSLPNASILLHKVLNYEFYLL